MSYLLDISTAVPEFAVTSHQLVKFCERSLQNSEKGNMEKKLTLFNERTGIKNRYSCLPDFHGNEYELYTDGNYMQPVEKRMAVYKKKIVPLAAKAISKILFQTGVSAANITHLITVSCTGVYAPGIEFMIAEQFGLQHTEKLALNFLGCYAAIKALKHAYYIAEGDPDACILIVCAELCSLHYYPAVADEEIISNLLFADGAAAVIVCGNKNKYVNNRIVLTIDAIGSSCVPNTLQLMTWNVSSSAFRMHLSKEIVLAIKNNIRPAVSEFLGDEKNKMKHWAIHPGGMRIVHAVAESLQLKEDEIENSINILQAYGNMSSPTILFVLNNILKKIKKTPVPEDEKIFSCAFGPGLSIEMIRFSPVDKRIDKNPSYTKPDYAVQI